MRAGLQHWHPILLRHELKRKPVGVKLCGEEIVVFRAADGTLGALPDRCPHRSMRLSKGWVEQDRLVCPYHSWSFDTKGHGKCPGTPRRWIEVPPLAVSEKYGAIWVKQGEGDAPFPGLAFPDWYPVVTLHHKIHAPVQLVLDNMTELEHTASVHTYFGFDVQSLEKVETTLEVEDDHMCIFYKGPQRHVPWFLRWAIGLRLGDIFVQYAKVNFSPIHTAYDLYWECQQFGERRDFRLKFAVFYNPVGDTESEMFTFAYSNLSPWNFLSINFLLIVILRSIIANEINQDIRIIENLNIGENGMPDFQVGRFDKPLLETRKFLKKIYFHGPGVRTV